MEELPECVHAIIASYCSDLKHREYFSLLSGNVGLKTEKDGKTYRNGLLHSFDDNPAWSCEDMKIWYHKGKRHRDSGPAIIYANGTEEWWKHGKPHRDHDLPAVKTTDGLLAWYQDGKCHRDNNQPSWIFQHQKKWFCHGTLIMSEPKNAFRALS